MTPVLTALRSLALLTLIGSALSVSVWAQSSDAAFPSPVTSSELSGTIKARDMGDPRLTTYYYVFDGGQGDIFVNVVSKNLTGDIDIFTEAGLRPLTKIVLYADAGGSETGRLIYLRRPERLILRVQGRTPGDEAATFQIKFAGAFVAMSPAKDDRAPTIDPASGDSDVTVNSVGTIVASRPKSKPSPRATPSDIASDDTATAEKKATSDEKPKSREVKKPVVVVDEISGVSEETSARPKKPATVARRPVRQRPRSTVAKPKATPPLKEEEAVDPLANVRLVVTMKDGAVIEKRLSELIRFSFDKGVLTLIGKDGNIVRYPMVDVAQVTVQ